MTDLKTITMTTVELAAMTGKRHDHVMRDADRALEAITTSRTACEKMAPDLGASIGVTETTYQDKYKRDKRMLILNKQMIFTIITGYDTALRFTVVGRWIELEQAANPAFGSQAITDTLIDLQSRVDMMTPAYAEHVRKGTTGRGYLWDEACRMAEVPADWSKRWMLATGRFIEDAPKFTDRAGTPRAIGPKPAGFSQGLFKRTPHTVKHGGTAFKVTAKGLDWLRAKGPEITAWVTEQKRTKALVDADGFVVDIVGDNAKGLTVRDVVSQL